MKNYFTKFDKKFIFDFDESKKIYYYYNISFPVFNGNFCFIMRDDNTFLNDHLEFSHETSNVFVCDLAAANKIINTEFRNYVKSTNLKWIGPKHKIRLVPIWEWGQCNE